jgi:hypothetical protein
MKKVSGGQQFSGSLDELSNVEVSEARQQRAERRDETMQGLWRKKTGSIRLENFYDQRRKQCHLTP